MVHNIYKCIIYNANFNYPSILVLAFISLYYTPIDFHNELLEYNIS